MKPVKHTIVIAAALFAAGFLSTSASHADALNDAYNSGYSAGFSAGYLAAGDGGGGGSKNQVILTSPPAGGFPGANTGGGSVSKHPGVGFYWSGTSNEWQAYRLETNATNTITPGAGLPMSEWWKAPEFLKDYGLDSSTVAPQLKKMREAIGTDYPNANIWVSTGANTQLK